MKFQWAKFSSMLDYDELIKVYGIAVNSAGITEKQIAMQMDTISRKAEQLKATFTGLATNSGGELSRLIKDGIGEVTNFLNVLNNISRGTYETIGTVTKATIAIYGLARAYKSIGVVMGIYSTAMLASAVSTGINTASQGVNTGAQISNAMAQGAKAVATGVNTVATNVNTIAQTRNAIATTIATGGLNLLIPSLVGSVLALDAYSMATDGAIASLDKLGKSTDAMSKMNEDMGVKENLVQSLKQRYDYVDTLTNAHTKLTKALANETEGSKEYNKLQKSLGATQEEIATIVGVTTEEIVQDGNLRMDLITQEKDNMEVKASEIKAEIKGIRDAQLKFTDDAIELAQSRIDAIGNEASAWGFLARAQMFAMEQYNGVMKMQIAAKTAVLNGMPEMTGKFAEMNPGMAQFVNDKRQQLTASIQSDTTYSASLENYKPASVTEKINGLAEEINGLKLKRARAALSNIDYDTTNQGSTVGNGEDKKGSDKSNGSMPPNDPNKVIARDAYKDAVVLATYKAKLATDDYAASIDNLNTVEEMYGKTADSTVNKLNTMQARWQSLNDQEWESQAMADELGMKLDNAIGDTMAFGISKDDYDAMSKEKRAELKVQYRDILDAHKDLKAVAAAYYAWEEKASKERLEKTKLGNDIKKESLGYKPEELESRRLSRNKTTEDIMIAQSTNPFDANNDRTLNAIHLKARQEDAKIYNDALLRLEKQLNKNKEALRSKDNEKNKEKNKEILQKMVDASQDAYDKQRAIVARNANDIKDLEYDKNAKISEGLAGIVDDVVVKGGTLKSVWNSLWSALASDAIKALFRIKNSSGGLLGSIAGLFGGSKSVEGATGGGSASSGSSGLNMSALGMATSFLFADGGLVDKPTNAIIGETGEQEAVINLGKLGRGDGRQQELLAYANSKYKGVGVTASASPKTVARAQEMSANATSQQISRDHIVELQKSNALMTQQVNIMMHIANSGSQGNTVTQPVVLKQSMSDGELASQLGRMKSQGYNV